MYTESSDIFDASGISDPIIGSKLLDIVGYSPDDFKIPQNIERFKTVVRFAKSAPDAIALLERAVFKGAYRPNSSKIDAAMHYIELRGRYEQTLKSMEELKRDISFYE